MRGIRASAVVCLVVALCAVVPACAQAFVPSTSPEVTAAFESLEGAMRGDPTLANLNGPGSLISAADKMSITRALGVVDAYERELYGRSLAENFLNKGPNGPDWTQVKLFEDDVTSGMTDSAGTATEAAVGGEFWDSVTPLLGGAVAMLLPLNGVVWYETITTGENFLSTAILGPQDDSKAIEEEERAEPIGVEGLTWVRIPREVEGVDECKEGGSVSACVTEALRLRGVTLPESGSREWEPCGDVGSGNGCGGMMEPRFGGLANPPVENYVLLYKDAVAGGHYWGLSGAAILTEHGWENGELTGPRKCQGVQGMPSTLVKSKLPHGGSVATRVISERIGSFPGFPTCFETAVVRPIQRMHTGFPHKIDKAEKEALEGEGKVLANKTGEPPSSLAGLEAEIEKLQKELVKPNHKPLKNALEHWTGSGGEHSEAPSSETPETPATPGHAEGESPPLPGAIGVPECIGATVGECEALLGAFELIPEVTELGWESADLSIPAGDVVETSPPAGDEVSPGSKVKVFTNPATMPKIVPKSTPNETGTEYAEKLGTEGFTNVEVKTLPETKEDPRVGPERVSYTNPAEGSKSLPGAKIDVEQNPDNAPAGEVPIPIKGPTLPGIKLPKFGVLCEGFPFGVPCWLASFIKGWSATPVAPKWGIDSFEIMEHKIPGASFDLSHLEPIMEKVRVAMVIFSTVGLVLLFYKFAKGGSPPSGSGGDADVGNTETHDLYPN